MTTEPEPDAAATLIRGWPTVADLLEPTRLQAERSGIKPGMAVLSFLAARRGIWTAHSMVVGYALDVTSDGYAAHSKLLEHTPGKWVHDSDFMEYFDAHPNRILPDWLDVYLRVIEEAINPSAMIEAQLDTIQINECIRRCGTENLQCLSECLQGL